MTILNLKCMIFVYYMKIVLNILLRLSNIYREMARRTLKQYTDYSESLLIYMDNIRLHNLEVDQ